MSNEKNNIQEGGLFSKEDFDSINKSKKWYLSTPIVVILAIAMPFSILAGPIVFGVLYVVEIVLLILMIKNYNASFNIIKNKMIDVNKIYSNSKSKINIPTEKTEIITNDIDDKVENEKTDDFKVVGNVSDLPLFVESKKNETNDEGWLEYKNFKKTKKIPSSGVVIHFDTTGFSPKTEQIIRISALKFENFKQVDYFDTLVSCDVEIQEEAKYKNNIDESFLVNAPNIKDVLETFLDFIGDYPIIAYTYFEFNFLAKALYDNGFDMLKNETMKTMNKTKELMPGLDTYSLPSLVYEFGIDSETEYNKKTVDCFNLLIYLNNFEIVANSPFGRNPFE